ncbi:hypothetical protein [Leucobacter sp.]
MAKKVKLYPLSNEWRFGKVSAAPKKKSSGKKKPSLPQNYVECPNCKQKVRELEDGRLLAHQWASNGRWCKAGSRPTDRKKKQAAKKRRSVWASSGGLPTLGNR